LAQAVGVIRVADRAPGRGFAGDAVEVVVGVVDSAVERVDDLPDAVALVVAVGDAAAVGDEGDRRQPVQVVVGVLADLVLAV
ncbi:hypothetical protein Tco_0616810, partial [Tanacetum coccineum]